MEKIIKDSIKQQQFIFILIAVIEFLLYLATLVFDLEKMIDFNIFLSYNVFFNYLILFFTFAPIPVIHYFYNKVVQKNRFIEDIEFKFSIYHKFNNIKLIILTFAGIIDLFVVIFNYQKQYFYMFLIVLIFFVIVIPNYEKFMKDFVNFEIKDETNEEITEETNEITEDNQDEINK